MEYRSTDVAGNVESRRKSLSVRVDVTAPTTTARINGAAPVADYTSAVRVAFTRSDGEDGSGAVKTEYRVNDGEWTEYMDAFDLTARQGYQIDFRSTDLVGNVENFQRVRFTIRPRRRGRGAGAAGPGRAGAEAVRGAGAGLLEAADAVRAARRPLHSST